MILNGAIDSVEVQRSRDVRPVGDVSVDIRFTDIGMFGDNVEASFTYEVEYKQDAGFLRMAGRLLIAPPSKEALQELMDGWKDGKKLPPEFAQDAINAAHMLCTINSPFATRIVDLAPPIMPMAVTFAKSQPQAPQSPQEKRAKKK